MAAENLYNGVVLTCADNSERFIHRTSSFASDLAVTLDMLLRTEIRCHNWGVARAIDRHNEDTA